MMMKEAMVDGKLLPIELGVTATDHRKRRNQSIEWIVRSLTVRPSYAIAHSLLDARDDLP
jgi:hypothetical protein